MSGILTYAKSHKRKILTTVFIVLCLALLIACLLFHNIAVSVICAAILFAVFVNETVRRRLNAQRGYFDAGSHVRNVDCLMIGDMCDVSGFLSAEESSVQLTAPGRTLEASYEILRHTWSILKDGGCVIFAVKEKNTNQHARAISVFDIPFLHSITIKKLGLERLKRMQSFPLIAAPLKAVRFFLGSHLKKWEKAVCPAREIEMFCRERGLTLIYMQ